jgi:hypothetical protein
MYRKFARYDTYRRGLLAWEWQVTDGIGGTLLASGHRRTRRAALSDAMLAAAECRPWTPQGQLLADLDVVVERLHAAGIDVSAEVDERGRVCVRPLCACSDVDHRRVLLAFCRIVGPVRWAGMGTAPYASEADRG